MNIKSLLLGSAAALVAVSGARAADAIVAAEPEPVEYVRVCDAFGTGFFYIPGTETCLRIHGYVRYDIGGGDLFERTSATGDGTYNKRARFSFRTSTASETELGTLRTYTELRFQWDTNNAVGGYTNDNEFSVNFAWIQLGGLRIGKDESMFTTFTGYAGSVINDGLLFDPGPFDTNLISYTYNGGAFRAALALEQGATDTLVGGVRTGWGIDDYMPHVVAGIGYTAGMVDLSAVLGYDTREDIGLVQYGGWSAKIRADVTLNDQASVFAMLHYGENSSAYTTWANGLRTDETFAVTAGGSYKINDKATFNVQGNWRESNTAASDAWSLVGNVAYELVPGLTLTPEIAYRDNGLVNGDAFGGFFRVQRSF
ncbi:porin [Hoeflea sp. YIM 152468]|uniref:porin n=1 Tax=Hoeflea sp. YIM 152468 TaxID=3031759 RepID=UPI0023D99B75|nr:porin [Hoeflea sp. YIM 152468]MDF1607721.1 porin [Hoeflea sp. YIM 152468]